MKNNNWVLDKWYKKTAYVIGIIYATMFCLGFIMGFIGAIFG